MQSKQQVQTHFGSCSLFGGVGGVKQKMKMKKKREEVLLSLLVVQTHHFNRRSSVCSVVMALIPCCMVGVSTLKGQSLCVSLETPRSWIKL